MNGSNGTTRGSRRTIGWTRSIRLRLSVIAVLILFLGGAVLWIKQSTWKGVRRIQEEFASVQTGSFFLGIHAQGIIWKLNGELLRYQLAQEQPEREAFHREARELSDRLAQNLPRLTTKEESELALELQRALGAYLAEASTLLEQGVRPVRKDSAALVYQQIAQKSEPLLAVCDRLAQCQDVTLARHFSAAEAALGSLRGWMQFSSLLLLACTAALGWLTYRAVVLPLRFKLNQTQETVVRQEKLASLGTLAAGVAHEIRNPLTAIKFRLFSFGKELPDDFAKHEDLTVINGEIERLERIVADFLEFARPSDPKLEELAAAEILQKVRNLLKSSLEARAIDLKLELPVPVRLRADAHQLEQVLINLVQNGAESIGRGGTITLRATTGVGSLEGRTTSVVIFEVTDTGKGIPPEAEQRIFDPFFSTKEGGTGLGLPIAARIAERHGGSINYRSQLKRGTTFSLVLPRISDDANTDSSH